MSESDTPSWHLVFEGDAMPGSHVAGTPSWALDAITRAGPNAHVINFGPNDIYPDWTKMHSHGRTQTADVLRYVFGGALPLLPGFGTLTHAYAVTNVGAAKLVDALWPKRCGLRGIDTELRDLRFSVPSGFFGRIFAKGQRKGSGTTRFWGMFGQANHACGTCKT